MCHIATGSSFDRTIHPDDLRLISRFYPDVSYALLEKIYNAITDANHPQPAVLVTIAEFVSRWQRSDTGMYPWPTIPFSAMDLSTLERVQTRPMKSFHSVFESFVLAERNVRLLNEVLATHGCRMCFFCDCGGCITDIETDIFGTREYQLINQVRSLAEAEGTPLISVESFEDLEWKRRELDMGSEEIASYLRMWTTLQSLPSRAMNMAGTLREGISYLQNQRGYKPARAQSTAEFL